MRGVRAETSAGPHVFTARHGVVLASGGFEWNSDLVSAFLPGPITHPLSPPMNDGDGLLMAMSVGSALANMDEALWSTAGAIPGETYEGRPLARFLATVQGGAHSIIVNRAGHRFGNETLGYKGLGYLQRYFDPAPAVYDHPNLEAWSIMDSQFRARHPILTLTPADPDPAWLPRADSLEELATVAGVNATGLIGTVERWNRHVGDGHDPDFGRQVPTERYRNLAGLGTIDKPPFYALAVHPGALGTSGGPRTDQHGRVLHVSGEPVPGLLAAGTVAASPAGRAYYGNGGSIGPTMTWGYICGETVTGHVR